MVEYADCKLVMLGSNSLNVLFGFEFIYDYQSCRFTMILKI